MKRELIISALKGYEAQLDNALCLAVKDQKNIYFLNDQINEAKKALAQYATY